VMLEFCTVLQVSQAEKRRCCAARNALSMWRTALQKPLFNRRPPASQDSAQSLVDRLALLEEPLVERLASIRSIVKGVVSILVGKEVVVKEDGALLRGVQYR